MPHFSRYAVLGSASVYHLGYRRRYHKKSALGQEAEAPQRLIKVYLILAEASVVFL